MAGMCKVILIGHLGRDPEMRYTPDGLAVTNFSLAANEKVKGEDRTQWFRVTTFGKFAEICSQYLVKGKLVYVEGRLETSEWEDREGKKRFTLEVIANQMQMLSPKTDPASQGAAGYQGAPQYGGGYQGAPGGGYQGAPYQGGGYQGHPQQGTGYQPGQAGGYQGAPYQGGGYQGPPQQGGGYQGDPYQKGGYQGTPQQGGGFQGSPGGVYSEPSYQGDAGNDPNKPENPPARNISPDSRQNEEHYKEAHKADDQVYKEPSASPEEKYRQPDEEKITPSGGDMGGPSPSKSVVEDDDIPF